MSVPIPYALEYSSTMSGAVLKVVHCEGCGTEYVYQLDRTATGSGTSLLFADNEGAAGRASSRAEASSRRKLERGVDLVPCPVCGWYQANMIPKARRNHRRWMLNTGLYLSICLIPVTGIAGLVNSANRVEPRIPWPLFLGVLGAVAIFGIGLMVAKFVSSRQYDPNSQDVEIRKQLGQGRAMLREEFEKLLRAQQEDSAAQGGQA